MRDIFKIDYISFKDEMSKMDRETLEELLVYSRGILNELLSDDVKLTIEAAETEIDILTHKATHKANVCDNIHEEDKACLKIHTIQGANIYDTQIDDELKRSSKLKKGLQTLKRLIFEDLY